MNEIKINQSKTIVSTINNMEILKKDIDILEKIESSNVFIMTSFLGGDNSTENYSYSITSDNIMDGENGDIYQSFITSLIKSKKKQLEIESGVLDYLTEKC